MHLGENIATFHMTETVSQLISRIKRRVRTLNKYKAKALQKWEECKRHEEVLKQAELLSIFIYAKKKHADKIDLTDLETGALFTLPLDPSKPPHQLVADHFKKAKKLKLGLPFAEKELQKCESALLHFENTLHQLSHIDGLSEELRLTLLNNIETKLPLKKQKPAKSHEPIKKKPYKEFFSQSGIAIWVGKNAAMNDEMTFSHARGNDLWLHASGCPGSHVVIHLGKRELPDEEALQDAFQLALCHSQAKNRGEGDVAMTRVKFVKRWGKQKGKVQIAHEKQFRVKADLLRLARIRGVVSPPHP